MYRNSMLYAYNYLCLFITYAIIDAEKLYT